MCAEKNEIQKFAILKGAKEFTGKIFLACAKKGHGIKTVIETISKFSSRVIMQFTPDGIYARPKDSADRVLFDLCLTSDSFNKYKCDEVYVRSFNVSQVTKNIAGLKKKDSLIIFINEDAPNKLYFYVTPIASDNDSEIFGFECQIESEYCPDPLPTKYIDDKGKKVNVYKNPVVVETARFQKIKTITNQVKSFTIAVQDRNFFTAFSKMGNMSSSAIVSGELIDDIECYESDFQSQIFKILCKLNSISKNIKIYAPCIEQFPLKLKIAVDAYGSLEIFVKDIKQIEYEIEENAELTHKKIKKKNRK
jgi:hypothetical protein